MCRLLSFRRTTSPIAQRLYLEYSNAHGMTLISVKVVPDRDAELTFLHRKKNILQKIAYGEARPFGRAFRCVPACDG
jgi:hypothetical protein